jgi:hypothetical protein
MDDKNEIERRKQITRELKLKAKQEFYNSLPTSAENFKALFDYLDKQLSKNDCDHSLKFSINFLESLKLGNTQEIAEWLKHNEGYCDCEVLANVEEKFDGQLVRPA